MSNTPTRITHIIPPELPHKITSERGAMLAESNLPDIGCGCPANDPSASLLVPKPIIHVRPNPKSLSIDTGLANSHFALFFA